MYAAMLKIKTELLAKYHCAKSVQVRSFFCSVFSRIWTEYGEMRSISPYLVRMRQNTDQKKLCIWTFFPQCINKSFENTLKMALLIMNVIAKKAFITSLKSQTFHI